MLCVDVRVVIFGEFVGLWGIVRSLNVGMVVEVREV